MNRYQGIVEEATAFMQANLSKPISVPQIAKQVFCGDRHLARAFHQVTGESPVACLLRLRLQKAMVLLRETDLSVTEIGVGAGFSNPAYFAATFRRKKGVSPTAFRAKARESGETPASEFDEGLGQGSGQWFSDTFEGTTLGPCWRVVEGAWQTKDGMLCGQGPEHAHIRFEHPLPENFRLGFDVQFLSAPGLAPSDLLAFLEDDSEQQIYCGVAIGAQENTVGELRLASRTQRSPTALLKTDGTWQRVEVALQDDVMQLLLDGSEVLRFRDPFPPPYAKRCKLRFGSWRSTFRIRGFEIHDLGFASMVRAVRQGDSLYQAGLFERACDFYMRRLGAESSPGETMELRYKVGMSYLQQSVFSQAEAWLGKVVVLPGDDVWKKEAGLGLLEVSWKQRGVREFLRVSRDLFAIAGMRDGVRALAERVCDDLGARGSYSDLIVVRELLFELEADGSTQQYHAQSRLASALQTGSRLAESKEHLTSIVDSAGVHQELVRQSLNDLIYVAAQQGELQQAQVLIRQLREKTLNRSLLARCAAFDAYLAGARGNLHEAIRRFVRIHKDYADTPIMGAFALVMASPMYCLLGEFKKAWRAMDLAKEADAGIGILRAGTRSRYMYVPWLMQGKYQKAADVLIEDARVETGRIADHAEQMVKAGILLELGDGGFRAHEIWQEAVRRFPESRCCFYASLALRLLAQEQDNLESMIYPPETRSEMLYLVALLWEKRGNRARCNALLKMSVAADGTLRWPAWSAKAKLRNWNG